MSSTPCTSSIAPETEPETEAARGPVTTLKSIFSLPVVCMMLLAAAILASCIRGFGQPEDVWWHMLNARHLFQSHQIPRFDSYSFTAAGSPWISFEWLSEIPYYLAYRLAGLRGILALYFAVLVLIFAAVYYRSCRAGADCKDAAIATLAAICMGGVSMGPRMLLFGWLCLTGLILVLDEFKRTGRGLWLLPAIFALWINLHGSWIFGFVVLGTTILSGLVEGHWGSVTADRWNRAELRKLFWASAGSGVAVFLNPYGYKLVLYPFDLLFRQGTLMRNIQEWQPVDFSDQTGMLALLLIFSILAAALFYRREWRLDEVLLTGFALWTALTHRRFLFFAALIIVPVFAPCLKLFPPYERESDKPFLNAALIAGGLAALIFFFPSSHDLQQRLDDRNPTAALNFVQAKHMSGRIFNRYEWGGYMEWNAPGLKTFIDGRTDIFIYNGVFNDYLKILWVNNPLERLDAYRIDYVLVEPESPLGYALAKSGKWRTIYSDPVAVLFERQPAA